MGHTACTEPQCLYTGALYFTFFYSFVDVDREDRCLILELVFIWYDIQSDRLCGLVVRVSSYRYRGLGFDSRRYKIF